MRSLTPVEAAVAVAIAGSVLTATVPGFVKNLRASKTTEPLEGLRHIAARAAALADTRPTTAAYPASVGVTPADVPRGEQAMDPPGTWSHATWRALDMEFTAPHAYSFAFESKNGEGYATYRARAHGDLDGDGIRSTFAIAGEKRGSADPVTSPIDVEHEVE
jgi:type IV pilus assembly protein PilA